MRGTILAATLFKVYLTAPGKYYYHGEGFARAAPKKRVPLLRVWNMHRHGVKGPIDLLVYHVKERLNVCKMRRQDFCLLVRPSSTWWSRFAKPRCAKPRCASHQCRAVPFHSIPVPDGRNPRGSAPAPLTTFYPFSSRSHMTPTSAPAFLRDSSKYPLTPIGNKDG